MEIGFYDPFIREGLDLALGFQHFRDLDDLLARADVVSLHAALTDTTRNMIDADRLKAMKPDAAACSTSLRSMRHSRRTAWAARASTCCPANRRNLTLC